MAKQYIMHEKGDMLQGRYCIDSVLGEGGFGVTYKAKDTYMDVPVAIKEYNNKNVSGYDEAVKEAKIAAGFYELDCIASARDFFVENDLAYIVMEYVSGISIKRYIKENGHMSGQVVLNKVKPLMQSLLKIHENGVIHRDISSDNLMITKDKKLVLIDFGAARFMKEYENRDYTVIVKRGFSPIEQCHSNGRQGPYTDIYSLCATIYYMITGIIPDDCVERVVKDKLKPISAIDGTGLTANECAAIMKGMEVWPDNRYSTMADLYNALYVTDGNLQENDSIAAIPEVYSEKGYTPKTRTGTTFSMYNAVKAFYDSRGNVKKKLYVISMLLVVVLVMGVLIGQGLRANNKNNISNNTGNGNNNVNEVIANTPDRLSSEVSSVKHETEEGDTNENNDKSAPSPQQKATDEPTESDQQKLSDKSKTTSNNNKPKKTSKPKATEKPLKSKPIPSKKPENSKTQDNSKTDQSDFFSGDLDGFME